VREVPTLWDGTEDEVSEKRWTRRKELPYLKGKILKQLERILMTKKRVKVGRVFDIERIPGTDGLVDYFVLDEHGSRLAPISVVDSVYSKRREGDLVLYVPPGCWVPLEGPKSEPWQFLKNSLDYRKGQEFYKIRPRKFQGNLSWGITVDRPLGSLVGDELGYAMNIIEPESSYIPVLYGYPGQRLLQYIKDIFSWRRK
jgi:hypothetical protein